MQVKRGTAQSKHRPPNIFSFGGHSRFHLQKQEFRFTNLKPSHLGNRVHDGRGCYCRTRTATKGSGSRQGRQSRKRWEAIRRMRWGSR
jgi:hypothetical protein